MKVIKKCLKVATCFTVLAAAGLSFTAIPSVSTYAAVENDGTVATKSEFEVKQFPTSVDATLEPTVEKPEQGRFLIPQLEGVTDYSILVFDPAGQKHTATFEASSLTETDNGFFQSANNKVEVLVLNNGTYKVVYKVGEQYSNTYRVEVKNVSYELSFVNNGLNALVRPTVDVTDKTDSANWVKLPTAKVNKLNEDETVETNFSADIKVTFDGAPIDYETYATIDAAKTAISASTASIKYVNIETGTEAGRYVIPSEEGKFAITYSYNAGANRPSKTFTISVVEDFEAPTELTVSTPTLPSFELGDTGIKLPELKVSNKYSDNVSYNIQKVEIKVKDSKNQVINTLELTNNDLTFDTTLSENWSDKTSYDKLVGNYEFTYTVVDAYGNTKAVTYKKEGVTISTNPTVSMAYNYTVTTTEGVKTVNADEVNTNYEADLKMQYSYNNIVVPAAYAEDKISAYNDLIIVRTLVDESTREVYYVDNVKYENGALVALDSYDNKNYALEEGYVPDVSKAVKFRFASTAAEEDDYAGKTFILRYQVYAKTVKSRSGRLVSDSTSNEYTFKVVGTEEESTPEIRIENLSSVVSANPDEKISVKVSASDEKDSRLATRVFYFEGTSVDEEALKTTVSTAVRTVLDDAGYVYGASNVLDDANFLTSVKATSAYSTFAPATVDEDNANIYSFNATTNSIAVAITVNDNGNIALATKIVKIKNTTETNAPIYTVIDAADFSSIENDTTIYQVTANVGDTVKLPTISFDDDVANGGDSSLAMNLVYYIDSPETSVGIKYLTPSNYSLSNNTIKGGEIFASKEGTYNVIYTATDDAGNISAVSFVFTVVEIKKPVIKVDVTGDDIEYVDGVVTATSGSIIKLDAAEINYNYTTDVQIVNGGLYYESLGDNEYQFFGAGTYTVKFNSIGAEGTAEEKVIKVKIEAAELEWTDEFATVPEYARLNDTVFLPLATTNDGAKVDVKVTLGKDGQEVDVTYVNDGWTFVPEKNGVYYVTYTAENDNYVLDDDSSVFTINVGDNVEPKLTVTEKAKLSQDIVYDGENNIEYKLSINTTNKTLIVTIINDGKETKIDTGLSVKDKNDAGTTDDNTSALWRSIKAELTSEKEIIEEGEVNQWFITGTGEVTLKITATDKYEKVGELVINFNVVTETEADSNKDTVVGIVLIVVSLVILAGVISYFAFAGKKGGSTKSKKNKVTEVETENETTEVVEEKVETAEVAEETEKEEVVETTEEKTEETDAEAKSGDVE